MSGTVFLKRKHFLSQDVCRGHGWIGDSYWAMPEIMVSNREMFSDAARVDAAYGPRLRFRPIKTDPSPMFNRGGARALATYTGLFERDDYNVACVYRTQCGVIVGINRKILKLARLLSGDLRDDFPRLWVAPDDFVVWNAEAFAATTMTIAARKLTPSIVAILGGVEADRPHPTPATPPPPQPPDGPADDGGVAIERINREH